MFRGQNTCSMILRFLHSGEKTLFSKDRNMSSKFYKSTKISHVFKMRPFLKRKRENIMSGYGLHYAVALAPGIYE